MSRYKAGVVNHASEEMAKSTPLTPEIVPLLLDWYHAAHRDLPWRADRDPYHILVSEIMLQQTRAETVIPYYHRFLAALPTLSDLAAADDETLHKLWEGLGYYSRVRNLGRAARAVMENYGGKIPADFSALLSLPGVGRYTAGAIASIAFDIPVPAVDGNVLRVLARLCGDDTDVLSPAARRQAEAALAPLVPTEGTGDFTQSLIELGATVCTPGESPRCEDCPLRLLCVAAREGKQAVLPVRLAKTRRRVEERTVLLVYATVDGERRVAIRRRPESGLLAGLYEFPCMDGHATAEEVEAHLSGLGFSLEEGSTPARLPSAKHIFSHIEWHMMGYSVTVTLPSSPPEDWAFVTLEDLDERYAIPSAYSAYRALL